MKRLWVVVALLLFTLAVHADDKVAFVTGGTSGIGYATVKALLDDGWKVVTFGRTQEKADEAFRSLGKHPNLMVGVADVGSYSDMQRIVDTAEAKFGVPKLMIHSAGVTGPFAPLGLIPDAEIQATIHTNLVGAINANAVVLERMKRAGIKGTVINLSSAAARGNPGGSLYSASKAGVNAMSVAVAQEYAPFGIRVFSFNPGHVDTGMQARARAADPAYFPLARKALDAYLTGALLDPAEVARNLIYLEKYGAIFPTGQMIDHGSVLEKRKELGEIVPPAAMEAAKAKLITKFDDAKAYEKMPRVLVDGVSAGKPVSVEAAISMADFIRKAIENAEGPTVKLQIGTETFEIHKEPLGKGMTGIVYSVVDSDKVIKLSRGHPVALNSMLEEQALSSELERIAKTEKFETPKNYFFDPLGVLSVKEKIVGEPLTEFLFRKGLLQIDAGKGTAKITVSGSGPEGDPLVEQVKAKVLHLMALRKKYPHLISDLGPDNLFIVTDGAGNLKELQFVDIGPSGAATKQKFDAAEGWDGYLNVAQTLVQRYVDTKVVDVNRLSLLCRAGLAGVAPH